MSKIRKTLFLLFLFSAWIFLTVHGAQAVESFSVASCSQKTLSLDLVNSEKVYGSFSVTSSDSSLPADINFEVLDNTSPELSVGQTILDIRTVTGGASFNFTASRSGNFVLVFDNTLGCRVSGANSPKDVRLTYDVLRPAPGSSPNLQSAQSAAPLIVYGFVAGIGGLSLIGAAGVALYVAGYRIRKTPSVLRSGSTIPNFVKIALLVELGVIVFLSAWIYQEYLNNAYLRTYLGQLNVRADIFTTVAIIFGLSLALIFTRLYTKLRRTRRKG